MLVRDRKPKTHQVSFVYFFSVFDVIHYIYSTQVSLAKFCFNVKFRKIGGSLDYMSLSKLWVCEQSRFKNMEFIMGDYFRLLSRFPRLFFRSGPWERAEKRLGVLQKPDASLGKGMYFHKRYSQLIRRSL